MVPRLENVGNRVLRDAPDPTRQEIDDRDSHPRAGAHPKRGKTLTKPKARAREQATGADPSTHERTDEEVPGNTPPRDHEVVLGFYLSRSVEADADEKQEVQDDDDEVDVHFLILLQCTISKIQRKGAKTRRRKGVSI